MIVYIYCLIDPRCGSPFYVGASGYPKNRLSDHISYAYNDTGFSFTAKRKKKLYDIIKSGNKPVLKILKKSDTLKAGHYEHFYFKKLSRKGFSLFQSPDRFGYSESYATRLKNRITENQ